MEPVITVGLDGSPESLAAARWAADEAARRKLTLRLLHAWPMLGPEPARPVEVDQNYWAKRMVHTARSELRARHPGLTVVGDLVAEEAQDALLHAAARSEMVVLGSRGLDRMETLFVGDISLFVAGRAERPVVLVRAGTELAEPSPAPGEQGDVAVALKLHGSCDELLAFAFTSAAARGAPVRAVHGRSLPVTAYVPWGVDSDVADAIRQEAEAELEQALRPWRQKFPGVEVTENIRLESPAKAVLRTARTAGLLVVGRRRRRRALAPLLGSVTHAALHHVRCPVAVVPHD